MKICIFGAGAIGGYMGVKLAQAGADVSLVARGPHLAAMKEKGHRPRFAAALTSSSASLAIIIPPSIPMIVYAVSANTSVEQLFVAGVVPGIIGAAGLMGVAYAFARRYDLPTEDAFDTGRLKRTFVAALPTFLLPIIILGGIFGGFVTATEGAGLAVVASILIGFIYNELDWRRLQSALIDGGVSESAQCNPAGDAGFRAVETPADRRCIGTHGGLAGDAELLNGRPVHLTRLGGGADFVVDPGHGSSPKKN